MFQLLLDFIFKYSAKKPDHDYLSPVLICSIHYEPKTGLLTSFLTGFQSVLKLKVSPTYRQN